LSKGNQGIQRSEASLTPYDPSFDGMGSMGLKGVSFAEHDEFPLDEFPFQIRFRNIFYATFFVHL